MASIRDLVMNKNVSDKLLRIILLCLDYKKSGNRLTHQKVANDLGIGIATVERCFRKLKKEGLVKSTRIGSRTWKHEFDLEEFRKEGEEVDHHSRDGQVYNNNLYYKYNNNILNNNFIYTDKKQYKETYMSSLIYSISERLAHHILTGDNINLEPFKEDLRMSNIYGPDSDIKNQISKVLSSSKFKSDIYQVKRSNAYNSFKEKKISEYNCNDLWFILEGEWTKHWRGKFANLTNQDRSKLKKLIEEFGVEDVVEAIPYIFTNWLDISRRYRLSGFPSVSVIYGYRRSLIPEALNGQAQPSWGAECPNSDEPSSIGVWR